ncbi:MAG: DUF4474 domain-containing protein [Dorea sp.]|jgi:hypothetical protein|nr:DUF4474 domain-containing protein [Dorea sp.]
MYLIFPCILLLLIICALLMTWRRKAITRKLCCMPVQEKLKKLNRLTQPFGFKYLLSQDIFTSLKDAWQRDLGYCWLYDRHAAAFGMVLDCETIYFDYRDCTWLIELWKGQYGINTGAEIGIYKADSLVPRNQRRSALFHTVPDKDLPFFEYTLYRGMMPVFRTAQRHWWLTGFRMGEYSEPDELFMKVSITFPSTEMQVAFVRGLIDRNYKPEDICIDHQQVCFDLCVPHTRQPRRPHSIRAAYSQWKNRIFLKLYCRVTKHFCLTLDKLLYLYEYLPFAFRHMLRIRTSRRPRRLKHRRSKRRHRHDC